MKTTTKSVLIFIAIATSCFSLSAIFFTFLHVTKRLEGIYRDSAELFNILNNLRMLFTSILGISASLVLLCSALLIWFVVHKLNYISRDSAKANDLLLTFKPPRAYEIEKLNLKLSELYIKEARNKGKNNYFLNREIRKVEDKIDKLRDIDSNTLRE